MGKNAGQILPKTRSSDARRALLRGGPLPAQSLAADPAAPIRALEAQLKSSQSQSGSFDYAAVARAAAGTLDLDAMARFVLGTEAAQSSHAERERVAAMLVARITRELNRRRRTAAGGQLNIVRTRSIGNGEWLVTTTATSADDHIAVLAWRVRDGGRRAAYRRRAQRRSKHADPDPARAGVALAREDLDTVIGRLERKYGAPPR